MHTFLRRTFHTVIVGILVVLSLLPVSAHHPDLVPSSPQVITTVEAALFSIPTNGSVTGRFNDIRCNSRGCGRHSAVDIASPLLAPGKGQPVYAPYGGQGIQNTGTVTSVSDDGGDCFAGVAHVITIDHGWIAARGKFVKTRYNHMANKDTRVSHIVVRPGDRVYRGMLLGYQGNAPSACATGVHLHWTVYESDSRTALGTPVDPEIYTGPLGSSVGETSSQYYQLSYLPKETPFVLIDKQVFMTSINGHLLERAWDTALQRWVWHDHGSPPGIALASSPGGVMTAATTGIKFFLTTVDGRIFERYWDQASTSWGWTDHGRPPGTRAVGAPGAAMTSANTGIKFFVTTTDGRLFERYWDQASTSWGWTEHGTPPGTVVASVPGSVMTESNTGIKLFVTAANGRLFERYWDQASTSWGWTDHGTPPGTQISGAPGATMVAAQTGIKLFVTTTDGRLFERYWDQGSATWGWTDHGRPPGTSVASAPPGAVMIEANTGIKLFVTTTDGRLFERYWDQGSATWGWTEHGHPANAQVASAPGAPMTAIDTGIKLFIATSDGRLYERYWDQGSETWNWTDHGADIPSAIGSMGDFYTTFVPMIVRN